MVNNEVCWRSPFLCFGAPPTSFSTPFGSLWPPFGCSWAAFGSLGLPLGVSWALLARFGGAWEVSGELPGGPSALWRCLWVPDRPKTSKMEPPGTKMRRISIKKRSKFFKKCNRILLQSCSLQRLSQRETQANSLNFVPDLFFKVVPCNAFRKGNPKQIL